MAGWLAGWLVVQALAALGLLGLPNSKAGPPTTGSSRGLQVVVLFSGRVNIGKVVFDC